MVRAVAVLVSQFIWCAAYGVECGPAITGEAVVSLSKQLDNALKKVQAHDRRLAASLRKAAADEDPEYWKQSREGALTGEVVHAGVNVQQSLAQLDLLQQIRSGMVNKADRITVERFMSGRAHRVGRAAVEGKDQIRRALPRFSTLKVASDVATLHDVLTEIESSYGQCDVDSSPYRLRRP